MEVLTASGIADGSLHRVVSREIPRTNEGERPRLAAPHDHFRTGPDSGVVGRGKQRRAGRNRLPRGSGRIVASAVVECDVIARVITAPDDHLRAGPDSVVHITTG